MNERENTQTMSWKTLAKLAIYKDNAVLPAFLVCLMVYFVI